MNKRKIVSFLSNPYFKENKWRVIVGVMEDNREMEVEIASDKIDEINDVKIGDVILV